MAEGIILAGGYSSRMKSDKMLLNVNGAPLIFHTINSLKPYVKKIIVVTGHYHNELKSSLSKLDNVDVVYNPRYQEGMFTSIKTGVNHVSDDFFVLPGDCPFVRASTIHALLNTSGRVRVPTYRGESGHPIFFEKSLIKPLLNEDETNSNLKVFRDRCGYVGVEVDDKNILNDIDTVSDYESLLSN